MDNRSSAAYYYYQTTLWIDHEQRPVEGDIADDESDGFVDVNLSLYRVVSVGVHGVGGIRNIRVCLAGVLTLEETPVLEVLNVLTELGAAVESHAIVIANILDYIHREFIDEAEDLPALVRVIVFEEAVGRRPMENQQRVVLDDDELVSEVTRLRQANLLVTNVTPADYDMAETQSTEVDMPNMKTVPASEEAIAQLEKVCQGEGADLHCAICMGDEEDGQEEEFKRLPCAHLFHSKCVVPWLRTNASCPLCRLQLPS